MTINTIEDYEAMLAVIDELIDREPTPAPSSPEGERVARLVRMVEEYEARNFLSPADYERRRASKHGQTLELLLLIVAGAFVALIVYMLAAGVVSA